MTMPFEIMYRKRILVITDPQRRVYDGVPFSSREEWSSWQRLYGTPTKEEAEASVASWRKLNPHIEYAWRECAKLTTPDQPQP